MQHDEQQEEAFAEQIVREVEAKYPHADPEFRRSVVRLWIRQRLGIEKPPGQISTAQIGRYLGLSQQRASEVQRIALARTYLRLRQSNPELFHP